MADPDPDPKPENGNSPPPSEQTPLLNHREESDDLSRTLERLDNFLTLLGFNQARPWSFAVSCSAFVVVGILLPVAVLRLSGCRGCEAYQIEAFELGIVASQACLAAVSLLCLAHNLRKYGVRRFLFVDRHGDHLVRLNHDYVRQITSSFRLLFLWTLPIFVLKTVREIVRICYSPRESLWLSAAILVALVVSWSYVSTISLTASIVFHLVCHLQAIHFEDYGKLLRSESNVLALIEEHIRLRFHLSKISHRFRIFLVLQFLIVTASQFLTLLQITGFSGIITLINGGDFAVSSLVQVVGIIISLHAATRISHRAQGLSALASRWHAIMTCSSSSEQHRNSQSNMVNIEGAQALNSLVLSYSESDLESLDSATMPTNTRLASSVASYHQRQSLVLYLQSNPGGITIFGWTVDRGLINTIFFMQLTLITFLLGKTLVFTSNV